MDEKTRTRLEGMRFDRLGLKTDSREVREGDVFVAIKGTLHDGHDFARDALKKGAARIICERAVPGLAREDEGKVIVVEDTREVLGYITRRAFGDPSGSLEVYGVTGTNGKTTTVFLIDSVLSSAGRPSGLVSTVFTKTSGDSLRRSNMTTPDLVRLNELLSEMVSSGKKAAVLEISSHALDQKRVSGIGLDGAVFTNISPEHLDYHGNMERYLRDKSRIFDNLKPGGTGAVNLDDPLVGGLVKDLKHRRIVTFGVKTGADVRGGDLSLSVEGTRFALTAGKLGAARVSTDLIGGHNVYNMLAAAAVLVNSGLDLGAIVNGLENAPPVPGRLDPVISDAPFRVFVDYAHTPDALENVLRCLRSLAKKRLICVFGCGGDRDRTKRPVMGKIACEICDRVFITSDNPRTEDPSDILSQIEKGVLNKNNYSIIEQREDAIRRSLASAGEGDTVLIAGKGHEDHQIIGGRVIHFDDKEVARAALKDIGY